MEIEMSYNIEDPWPFMARFFKYTECRAESLFYECQQCSRIISASKRSRHNLKKHIESRHPETLHVFELCFMQGSKALKGKRRPRKNAVNLPSPDELHAVENYLRAQNEAPNHLLDVLSGGLSSGEGAYFGYDMNTNGAAELDDKSGVLIKTDGFPVEPLSEPEAQQCSSKAVRTALPRPDAGVDDGAAEQRQNDCAEPDGGMAAIDAAVAAATAAADPPAAAKPESYQLRHNNHMALVLTQLAEDEAFMDVTLTAEGRPVKAHKSVLSAVSPYFSSVLRENPSPHPVIIMPFHVTHRELTNIIMYIYKGEMTVSAADLPSLLKTAEELRITGLSANGAKSQPLLVPASPPSHTATQHPTATHHTTATHHHTTRPPSGPSLPQPHLNPPTMPLNPSDFIDVDMSCVKEEMAETEEIDDSSSQQVNSTLDAASALIYTSPNLPNPAAFEAPQKDSFSTDSKPCSNLNSSLSSNAFKNVTLVKPGSLDTPPTNLSPSGHDINQTSSDIPSATANALSFSQASSPSAIGAASPSVSPTVEPSPNVCPYCNEYVLANVESHITSKHPFKAAFICKTCTRIYTRKGRLEQHIKKCSKPS